MLSKSLRPNANGCAVKFYSKINKMDSKQLRGTSRAQLTENRRPRHQRDPPWKTFHLESLLRLGLPLEPLGTTPLLRSDCSWAQYYAKQGRKLSTFSPRTQNRRRSSSRNFSVLSSGRTTFLKMRPLRMCETGPTSFQSARVRPWFQSHLPSRKVCLIPICS